MVNRENMVQGDLYRVVENTGGHEFPIGEIVRFVYDDGDDDLNLVCQDIDGNDTWYLSENELEEV